MRLKQLLVVLLPLFIITTLAAMAAGMPQLTNVSVVGEGATTTVTVQASGPFTHNEYRPADNLLLVDLAGVSAGKLHERQRALAVPGIKSYRVIGYTGAGGTQIARVELTLVDHPQVQIKETKTGVVIQVAASAEALAATPQPVPSASVPETPAPVAGPKLVPAKVAGPAASAVQMVNVAVVRGEAGPEVQVTADAPLSGKMTKLVHPDRIVLDVVNALPAGKVYRFPVNSGDIRMVRVGRFQEEPPVTRIVVDLASPGDFELVENGNKLTLKSRGGQPDFAAAAPKPALQPAVAVEQPRTSSRPAAEARPAVDKPVPVSTPEVKLAKASVEPEYKGSETQTAKDFIVVQPKVEEHLGKSPDPSATPFKVESAGDKAARLLAASQGPVTTPAMAAPVAETPVLAAGPAQQPAPVAPAQPQPSVNMAAEQRQQSTQGAPALPPRYTGEPISVNLKDVDLRDFFRLIHEISGLNIVLDQSVKGSLTLVLDDVPWDQALDVVLKNNGLDRQLEGNVLRIASVENLRKEAEARRKQVDAQALAVEKVTVTRFLSYAHAKEVVTTLKKQLSPRGELVADERTNALVISDIPSKIPLFDRLLAQLDRKTQEVEIEARVVAATRTFARDIGTQFAFGWGNRPSAVGGALAASPLSDTSTSPLLLKAPGNPASIPLFTNLAANAPTSGLSFLNAGSSYRLDAILTAAESRGLLKVLSRPRVITQNHIQAVVKQGQRVPITTLGQLGGPPTVAYVEAVLRLTVTPQITAENTIFLNVDIENTTPDFSHTVQGNPVFLTQQTTTQVLVTNGGTVVIGGVLQTNNALNVSQVPLLGSVPALGNLFKRRSVSTSTQELIFFLTPRIVET
jgi:type IV pilus assembly protein PilQ